MDYRNGSTIKQWSEEDRPREKLILKGKAALSSTELLALLLGSGNRQATAVDVARQLLESANYNLSEMARWSVNDFTRHPGVGLARAVTIMAALELGNRKRTQEAMIKEKISGSRDVFEIMQGEMADTHYESFWVLLLNRANRMIRKVNISEGGISGTVADPKKIFKMALEFNASSMILCHNHPSGNVQPSEADIRLTKKMKQAGELFDLPVLDHLIFGGAAYFSFADEGTL